MTHKITLIPGDGIGPEVTNAVVRILEATGVKFEWETFAVGSEAYEKYGEYIPKDLISSLERTRVGLKGPVTTPVGGGFTRTFGRSATCRISRRVIPTSI
jgi:isocitrate dehydrogenase (NAD+)